MMIGPVEDLARGSCKSGDAAAAPPCLNSVELHELLGGLFGRSAPPPPLASWQSLGLEHPVYRLRFGHGPAGFSVIVKQLSPLSARRDQLAANRWLPALGLHGHGPPLLGIATRTLNGRHLWVAYEDCGDCRLDENAPDHDRVSAAVELIARVHTGFSVHGLLASCRREVSDYGASSFGDSVGDAIRSLESMDSSGARLCGEHLNLRDRLLERLHGLHAEAPDRSRAVRASGGPETLLHGDLWPKNVLLRESAGKLHVRLIDWERAGVGTVAYDLSAFLGRFPSRERSWISERYREAVARQAGWRLPPDPELDELFSTAVYTRLAVCVASAADSVRDEKADCALDDLNEIDGWLAQAVPILRVGTAASKDPSPCAT